MREEDVEDAQQMIFGFDESTMTKQEIVAFITSKDVDATYSQWSNEAHHSLPSRRNIQSSPRLVF